MNKSDESITISVSLIYRFTMAVSIALILANLIGLISRFYLGHEYVFGFIPKFDLDVEGNVPTWFSTFLLLLSSLLLGIIALFKNKNKDSYSRRWAILAFLFLCLSIDEASGLHELLIDPLNETFDFSGIFYLSWIIVGLVVILLLLFFYWRFFFRLPKRTRKSILLAATIYLSGAIGLEMVGGYCAYHYKHLALLYCIITTIEESLEMVGLVLLSKALLEYLYSYLPTISFAFTE